MVLEMKSKTIHVSQGSQLNPQSQSELKIKNKLPPNNKTETTKGEVSLLRVFDDEIYAKLAYENHHVYCKNEPYPHIVFDNFLPRPLAELISREFPKVKNRNSSFKYHNHDNVSRHFLEDTRYFSNNLKLFSAAISSRSFLLFLETLTGIKALLPDPYFMGGGAMMTGSGGFLNVHIDFNWHQKIQAWRRCNALFYFTENWMPEYSGNLELWSQDGSKKMKEIEPLFNRVVIFSTTSESYHGQPSKVQAPKDVYRNVFSAFYYATEKNEKIDSRPHYTKYNAIDNRVNNTADFDTSPYTESITEDFLRNIRL
jgi:Rps23 Pro-64 3,4-dihydroxylase Tpa1-like proline 4-hydroxylase